MGHMPCSGIAGLCTLQPTLAGCPPENMPVPFLHVPHWAWALSFLFTWANPMGKDGVQSSVSFLGLLVTYPGSICFTRILL